MEVFVYSLLILLGCILVAVFGYKFLFSKKEVEADEDEDLRIGGINLIKKYRGAELKSFTPLFLVTGLLLSLIFATVLIEWDKVTVIPPPPEPIEMDYADQVYDIPPTEQPPPEPPKIVAPEIVEVEDEEIVEEPDIEIDMEEEPADDMEIFQPAPEQKKEEVQEPVLFAQQMPEFPGGQGQLAQFIAKNFQYPSRDIEEEREGVIVVEFIVQKNGDITNPKIMKGISETLDAEALRIVNKMPDWKAGKNGGMPVPVRMRLPITAKLER